VRIVLNDEAIPKISFVLPVMTEGRASPVARPLTRPLATHPLIALDQNLEPAPGIVARWEIGDGGRTYTLHLDPRATFSDGTPVTANDVRFTLIKVLDAPSPQFSAWFEHLDRAKTVVLDARTIRVVFTEARAAQLLAFTISVLPEHIYGRGDVASNSSLVGNGPYVLHRRPSSGANNPAVLPLGFDRSAARSTRAA